MGESYGRLCNVEQVGVTTADAISAFFSEGHNVEIIKDLRKLKIVVTSEHPIDSLDTHLTVAEARVTKGNGPEKKTPARGRRP